MLGERPERSRTEGGWPAALRAEVLPPQGPRAAPCRDAAPRAPQRGARGAPGAAGRSPARAAVVRGPRRTLSQGVRGGEDGNGRARGGFGVPCAGEDVCLIAWRGRATARRSRARPWHADGSKLLIDFRLGGASAKVGDPRLGGGRVQGILLVFESGGSSSRQGRMFALLGSGPGPLAGCSVNFWFGRPGTQAGNSRLSGGKRCIFRFFGGGRGY